MTYDEYFKRGISKNSLQDYKGAIEDYSEAIRLKPDYAVAYYNRGNSKYSLQDYKGAIEDYSEAIRLNQTLLLLITTEESARIHFKTTKERLRTTVKQSD